MSSGFVSGGTNEEPVKRDQEWLDAQQDLEERRLRKEQEGKQEGGKSLYEILQQNKAAKQEAFEESIRLKNQFRTLDEDEVEFLDSVLESTRAQEAAIKKETSEQLEIFRRQREEAERVALLEEDPVEELGKVDEAEWAVSGRKRKRRDKKALKGVKLRKTSSPGAERGSPTSTDIDSKPLLAESAQTDRHDTARMAETGIPTTKPPAKASHDEKESGTSVVQSKSQSQIDKKEDVAQSVSSVKTSNEAAPTSFLGLGLGAYGSDDD